MSDQTDSVVPQSAPNKESWSCDSDVNERGYEEGTQRNKANTQQYEEHSNGHNYLLW